MPKITPFLWYDTEAGEAAQFYTSIFPNSKIKNTTILQNTPSGKVEIITIELYGQEFTLMSAGPLFKFTPAISFMIACNTKEEVDTLWKQLSQNGKVLMELDNYPFSERYGWTQDKYGLSWQIIYLGQTMPQRITPTLMFINQNCGKAEEAMKFYTSIFHNATMGDIFRYGKGQEPDKEGTVVHASFILENQHFAAMDSARQHNFNFNEAISFVVNCETQAEIDHYWKLSAVKEAEQCGWLKDKYGVSWQIVPTVLAKMLQDKQKAAKVTEAFLKMKKFDIETLKKVYDEQ